MPLPDALPRTTGDLAAFLGAALARFRDDRCLQVAGSLTFTTLLALVPLLAVALSLIAAFPVFSELTGEVDGWLAEHFLPEEVSAVVIDNMLQFADKASRLTAVGIAALGATALMMMLTIDRALNQIFRVSRPRPLAQRLLMYWAVLTLGPLLIGASISMTSYLVSSSLGLVRGAPILGEALLRLAPVVLTSAAIMLLYIWVPNRRVQLRHALIGALLAGIAFELMKRGFGLYIARFPTYTLVYGAFAAIPIFLVWLYLSWCVVLLGAALTAMIPGYSRADQRGRPAGQHFYEALDLLAHLVRAQRAGAVLPLVRLAHELRLPPESCERLLERMGALGWTARTHGDAWLLARDAAALRLSDIYRAFVLDERAGRGPLSAAAHALDPLMAEHYAGVGERLQVPLAELYDVEEAQPDESPRRRFELFAMIRRPRQP